MFHLVMQVLDFTCEVVWAQLNVQNHPISPISIWEELFECIQQIQQMFPDVVLILGGGS